MLKKIFVYLLVGISLLSLIFSILTKNQKDRIDTEIQLASEDYYLKIIENAKIIKQEVENLNNNESNSYYYIESQIINIKDYYEFFRLLHHFSDNMKEDSFIKRDEAITQLWNLLNMNEIGTDDFIHNISNELSKEVENLEKLNASIKS
ncbi:hypothetical protein PV403_24410 [Paenibacillus sp. GYB006]|uniref:hypothetical protein n=1 Tax=Paenibacillus sp. GYB006 TaxID=2994394 RepID=UPI002F96B9AE